MLPLPMPWPEAGVERVERRPPEDDFACFAAFFPSLLVDVLPAPKRALSVVVARGIWGLASECGKRRLGRLAGIPDQISSVSCAGWAVRGEAPPLEFACGDEPPGVRPKPSKLAANVVCARSFAECLPFGGASTSTELLDDCEKARAFWNPPPAPEGAAPPAAPEMPPTTTVAPSGDLYDFNKKLVSVCAACQRQITDRFILRVHPNLEFHAACLKCQKCFQSLDEKCTAFVRNGETYCRDDYLSLFGTKCVRCERVFDRQDLVMRARNLVFHVDCFTCFSCDRHLAPGEEYVVKEDELYCRPDCDPLTAEPSSAKTTDLFVRDEDECWDTSTLGSLENHATPPLSIKSPKSEEMPGYPLHNSSGSSAGSGSSGGSKKSKKDKQTTRVRTVLNENQLRMLKACYAQNSRPDAIEKERLVEMTGLTARVIRVWFQNKRCKDKKRQVEMKSRMAAAEKDRTLTNVRLHGIGPLVASSPASHHDQHLGGIAPLEIHHFPQNPGLWDPSLGAEPLPPPPYPPNMMNGFDELSGFGMAPPGAFYGASPHLSSPSCSE
ncbi:hypothetical protein QR680_009291 [Steinernema hermaphroditum]|uniref:Homeobox domain-containing protein n=1 Tax=Steinernema hermaphroditum TaxID=289476 RepID=A0AA39IJS1_9BILA|nr:hypothetical protein QR680_009291 [Steinernema hermaphroditum]